MVRNKLYTILPMLLLFTLLLATNTVAAMEKVYDYAHLFSASEKEELEAKASSLSSQLEIDFIVVTIDDNEGKSSRQYAEDFYNAHHFGYEQTSDGVLYLLNMDEREVYIYTRDRAYDYLPDFRIEEILDSVYPYLGEEKFSESVHVFMDEVERMMDSPESDFDSVAVPQDYRGAGTSSERSLLEELGIYLLISIAVGAITVGIMSINNKGRSTVNERTYLENNSFVVTKRVDRHYNTRVTKQRIQKNNNSGGGSFSGGFGGGGGGRSGGGGRKF
ncbi:TPM domain-containing protein [Bacillus sp. B15-48]|uniref:TPM domain-containing protein n=1 Tax=Bacillus sp. B15-48 TaxID=1548601 RepID=UPI00193F4DA9|nr:TPM domain-containing protein [Bacillus sp. B15-48]MBM4764647.1 TPM domain-containing protein [Bacillus sp. B15-48]